MLSRMFVTSALVLLSPWAPTAVYHEVPEAATPQRAVGPLVALAPDGLFGPRTRAAIRDWQASRGMPATGYLTGSEAELLRGADTSGTATPASEEAVGLPPAAAGPPEGSDEPAVSAPVPSEPQVATATSTLVAAPIREQPPAPERCDEWNTEEFFKSAPAADVSACLAAGADPEARDGSGRTPLHWAVAASDRPEVIEVLLAAGAALDAPDDDGDTPLLEALFSEHASVRATVAEALLAIGTDVTAADVVGVPLGGTHLHYVAAAHPDPAAKSFCIKHLATCPNQNSPTGDDKSDVARRTICSCLLSSDVACGRANPCQDFIRFLPAPSSSSCSLPPRLQRVRTSGRPL